MKKVLFLINSLSGGGAEKVLVDLVNILPSTQYKVTIVTLYGGIHEKRLPNNVTYRCLIKSSNKFLRRWGVILFCKVVSCKVFARLFLRGEYDVKVAYLNGFPTRVLAEDPDNNARKITFVHSDFSKYYGMEKIYKTREDCLKEYKSFDEVCFVAKAAKDGFFSSIGRLDNAKVVHNVIDVETVRQLSLQPINEKYETLGLKIITVGRLVKVKAFERLINISSYLKQSGIEHEIWILGEGDLHGDLEAQINKLGVSKHVKLLGFKSNPYQYVINADLYVCSSLYEGYSTSVAEALALGIPVLTTRCSGMDEILHNGEFGTIVSNDEDSLRNELHRIAHDQSVLEHYRTRALSGKVCYSPENSLREYDALFNDR